MRIVTTLVLTALCTCATARAQEDIRTTEQSAQMAQQSGITIENSDVRGAEFRPHEVDLSWGTATTPIIFNTFIKLITLGFAHIDNFSYGALHLSYLYYPTKHLGIGATMSYEHGFQNKENNKYVASYHYCSAMANLKLYWFNFPYVGMYSRFGLGATFGYGRTDNEYEMRWLPAFQLSIAGVEAGGKLRGFVEYGVGTMGVLQLGLRYKF